MPKDKQPTPPVAAPKKRNAIVSFFSDTIAEMKKVTWLSRREIIYLTGLVLIVAIVTGVILGAIDLGFSQLVSKFVIPGG
ncbi:MAG TPA: preprotein translocase subunit SecE [Dehalococcoidales bacterium]|nr:preprotein translocase subunit SecE [Dehalococcoidales bacterium]